LNNGTFFDGAVLAMIRLKSIITITSHAWLFLSLICQTKPAIHAAGSDKLRPHTIHPITSKTPGISSCLNLHHSTESWKYLLCKYKTATNASMQLSLFYMKNHMRLSQKDDSELHQITKEFNLPMK